LKAFQLVEAAADVLAAVAGPGREIISAPTDAVAEAEAALRAQRAEIEASRAQEHELGQAWLMASTQESAEEIARRRAELVRVADRGERLIPQLVAAKTEKQRQGLARHRAAIAAHVPKLVKAVEAAAAAQVEAIWLREAAIRDLGEGTVCANLEPLSYLGLLLPDLVAFRRRSVRPEAYGVSTSLALWRNSRAVFAHVRDSGGRMTKHVPRPGAVVGHPGSDPPEGCFNSAGRS
jgi:hypothetical protein